MKGTWDLSVTTCISELAALIRAHKCDPVARRAAAAPSHQTGNASAHFCLCCRLGRSARSIIAAACTHAHPWHARTHRREQRALIKHSHYTREEIPAGAVYWALVHFLLLLRPPASPPLYIFFFPFCVLPALFTSQSEIVPTGVFSCLL